MYLKQCLRKKDFKLASHVLGDKRDDRSLNNTSQRIKR